MLYERKPNMAKYFKHPDSNKHVSFTEGLLSMGFKKTSPPPNFPKHGQTFLIDHSPFHGYYWLYETKDFIMDIEDIFVDEDVIMDSFSFDDIIIMSTFLKSVSGECLYPYQQMNSNSVFITDNQNSNYKFLIHGGFPFTSVGVKFRKPMLQSYLNHYSDIESKSINNIFQHSSGFISNKICKIANDIMNNAPDHMGSDLFFEVKAKEWLSVTIDGYFSNNYSKKLSQSDDIALQNVTNYINDHIASDISQEFLTKIAMMSGTKLKNTFRQKYQMSITEYTQRKRMNMAEHLLSTTDLDIGEIAKSVGYSSHSRFSGLFKKYIGVYPSEIRKLKVTK